MLSRVSTGRMGGQALTMEKPGDPEADSGPSCVAWAPPFLSLHLRFPIVAEQQAGVCAGAELHCWRPSPAPKGLALAMSLWRR